MADSRDQRMHAAIAEALRALQARRGPATDTDRPRRKSQPARVLKGQLDLDGNEATTDGR